MTLTTCPPAVQIGDLTIDPPIFQAPMAGFTNAAFREVVRQFGGVGLLATEMVNARGFVWMDEHNHHQQPLEEPQEPQEPQEPPPEPLQELEDPEEPEAPSPEPLQEQPKEPPEEPQPGPMEAPEDFDTVEV